MEKIRLSKLMASRGICSRREADEWIARDLVRVDGEIVSTLGIRVSPDCNISIEEKARRQQRSLITVLLNKPVGYVSGQPEHGHLAAGTLIVKSNHYRNDKIRYRGRTNHQQRMAPAGRLDIDSQGLLILTQDGRIARRLIGQDCDIEKEYLVRVEGSIIPMKLRLLRHGLELDGRALKTAKVDEIEPKLLKFVLIEGRKRQIRRMCELVDLEVRSLKRVRIGRVKLAGLPRGEWRYLRANETF